MAIAIGYGTTFQWDGDTVGELTRIGPVSITIAKQDSTNLGATNAFKTMLPGLLDPGDVDLEGWFRPGDTGQAGMIADMLTRTVKEAIITFPTAISSSTWTMQAYVTSFTAGDATPEGIVPWTATISITGKPVLGVTASSGMTGLVAEETDATNIPYSPTVGATTYVYLGDTIVDTTTCLYVKITVTSTDAQITATCLGVEHVLTTTVKSEAITIGAAGTVTPVYIHCHGANKSPRNYTLWINRA